MIVTLTSKSGRKVQIGRAPKGGLEFGGKTYRGGQFCPLAALPIAGGEPETVKVPETTADLLAWSFTATRPNSRWIDQQRAKLGCWAPNPARDARLAEVEEAERRLETWKRFDGLARRCGFRRNSYDGRGRDGRTVEAGRGYVRKEAGRWTTYSHAEAVEVIRREAN